MTAFLVMRNLFYSTNISKQTAESFRTKKKNRTKFYKNFTKLLVAFRNRRQKKKKKIKPP